MKGVNSYPLILASGPFGVDEQEFPFCNQAIYGS
jgi:hypothetical protein